MVMFPGFFLVTKFGRGGDKNCHQFIWTVILGLSAPKNLLDINVKYHFWEELSTDFFTPWCKILGFAWFLTAA